MRYGLSDSSMRFIAHSIFSGLSTSSFAIPYASASFVKQGLPSMETAISRLSYAFS